MIEWQKYYFANLTNEVLRKMEVIQYEVQLKTPDYYYQGLISKQIVSAI